MLAIIDRWLGRLSARWVTALAFALVALVGLGDHLTSYDVSLLLLYLIPVAMTSWYAGKDAGISVALTASAVTLWIALGTNPFEKHYVAVLWTVASRFGAFLVIATLLDQLRTRLAIEQQLARIDPLTGSLNRHAFLEQLQYSMALAAREKLPFTLAYIDIDNFKQVNDTVGHEGGDKVLNAVACMLKQHSRRTDVVARLGGDEFAMLFPDTAQAGAQHIITKVKDSFDYAFASQQPRIGCSIGAVTFISAPATASDAIKAADLLMYEVKNSGKNSVAFRTIDPQTAPGKADQVTNGQSGCPDGK